MKFEYFIYYCTFTYSNNTTMTTIYILVALAVGFLVGWLFAGRKVSSKEVELAKAASDRDAALKVVECGTGKVGAAQYPTHGFATRTGGFRRASEGDAGEAGQPTERDGPAA
jgi:hypothetical protein